jgi:hypothetical protein
MHLLPPSLKPHFFQIVAIIFIMIAITQAIPLSWLAYRFHTTREHFQGIVP